MVDLREVAKIAPKCINYTYRFSLMEVTERQQEEDNATERFLLLSFPKMGAGHAGGPRGKVFALRTG